MVGPTAKPLRHNFLRGAHLPAAGGLSSRGKLSSEGRFLSARATDRPSQPWTGALARTGVATGTDFAGDPGSVLQPLPLRRLLRAALRETGLLRPRPQGSLRNTGPGQCPSVRVAVGGSRRADALTVLRPTDGSGQPATRNVLFADVPVPPKPHNGPTITREGAAFPAAPSAWRSTFLGSDGVSCGFPCGLVSRWRCRRRFRPYPSRRSSIRCRSSPGRQPHSGRRRSRHRMPPPTRSAN